MIKNMKKNDKKMTKTRGKLQFSIFWKFFAPLEAKMMKNDKKMIKNEKNEENCNFLFFGKLQVSSSFFSLFYHFLFIFLSFF
jgi:hypothetical protein